MLHYYSSYIRKAFDLAQDLRNIFEKATDKIFGLARLARWHEKVNESGFKSGKYLFYFRAKKKDHHF